MKIAIIVVLIAVAAVAAIYFFPPPADQNEFDQVVLDSAAYSESVQQISEKINDLSPTPPTEFSWTVREIEFVKNEPYAYVIYHDTHNLFRILIETGQNGTYRTVAAFEAEGQGWRLTGGEDLAKGKETVKISPN